MEKMIKKGSLVLFLIAILAIFSFSASALPTRLNVTMSEVVFQNVSYAKDFDLLNEQEACNVEGTINITNPSADPVFDIYLRFSNIAGLTTDFFHDQGRNGTVISGGSAQNQDVTSDIDATMNSVTLGLDLDNDGQNDYVYVNDTHLIFNMTRDGNVSVRLKDDAVLADISTVPQALNMTEVEFSANGRTYGNVTINGTTNNANELRNAEIDIVINEYSQSPIIVHIPELRGTNETIFVYNMSCLGKLPPVTINTTYTNPAHAGITKKVLAGYNWTLNQTVINNNPAGLPIANLNISMAAQSVTWNTSSFNFAFGTLAAGGDAGNVEKVDSTNWWWAPNAGTLAHGSNESILYNMTAPFSVPFSATYLSLIENISYEVNYLLSEMSLDEINASGDLEFDLDKRIDSPQDDLNNTNVTWEIRPYVNVPINISYDLNKVTLWVTHDLNPNNYTVFNKTMNNTGVPLEEINISNPWGTSAEYWYFNYTDGSSATSPPPIVWIEPEWLIANKYGQIMNYSKSVNGQDLYMKYVYVVNGYWLEIQKNITSIADGQYEINITVVNIGNGWTPINEKVTVYDFIPSEFSGWDWSVSPGTTQSVGAEGSAYYGNAMIWDIPWEPTLNSSLGPMNGPNATTAANHTWNVNYKVNGSGSYKATELYIVGLDPLKVDGAFASPIITIISGLQSRTNELVYVGIIAFLIVLNITNLVMTNRINKKISDRLPPPPMAKHGGHKRF